LYLSGKNMDMEIKPIAHFRSPFTSKFGIPKQSGLVEELRGEIVFESNYRDPTALHGLEDFDYIWLIWGFSANEHEAFSPTVRPPLLGGNVRMGVFATRSPFRPNPIGMSSVRIVSINIDTEQGPVITVSGADLMDGTPIYDIKPYVTFVDSHPGVRSGFVDRHHIHRLNVVVPPQFASHFDDTELTALIKTLELDPRPAYQNIPQKVYGMPFNGYDIKFQVEEDQLTVVGLDEIK
jgi:tRNA-Thr(GGU) m(6)t(6)A37 methyltransferase TsaA